MKKVLISVLIISISVRGISQSQEAQQLLLNWEKLGQFKAILQEMYNGYQVLYKGYGAIKDISEGNFDLHKNFLGGLLEISPAVKKYYKIAEIASLQLRIVKDYKAAYNQFKGDKNFTLQEIEYLGKVYKNLFNQSLRSLDQLLVIITAGTLRMSDDERLEGIDKVYDDIVQQFSFLQDFNNGAALLSIQRKKEAEDIDRSKKLYNIK